MLTQLVPQTGQVSPLGSANALVITDRAGNLARIESIIRRIDQATDAAVEVIPLQHASAESLARTLTLLIDEKPAAAIGGGQQTRVFSDGRTNSILLSGDRAARLRMRTMIGHLDTPLENSDSTNVIYVRYAKAADLVEILTQTANTLTRQNGDDKSSKSATIQSHADTNALVVTADPTVFRALSSVVRQLDVRRAQVMIEGVIAELSDETGNELGVQLGAPVNGLDDNTFIGGSNFSGTDGGGSISGFATNPLGVGAGLTLGYITGQSTITGPDGKPVSILNVAGLVRALKGSGKNNILSTPTLVTLDNQEAELSVGQEVPFIQGEFTTNAANAGGSAAQGIAGNPFRTIQRKEVGLKLTVTPHINEGDTVLLDIKQEVSSLAPTTNAASDLITNKRTLSTSVMVANRNMLVLGGLISTEVRENVSKVPGLGDIPILGNLFRYRSSNSTQRNLMLFLKPTILVDAATEHSVTSEKYNFIRASQQRARVQKENLAPDEVHPVLPEMPAAEKPAERQPQ